MRATLLCLLLLTGSITPSFAQTNPPGSAPAASQEAPAAAPTTQAAETPGEEELICKNEQVTGSRLKGRRVCKTEQQWRDDAQNARNTTDRLQRPLGNPQGN